MQNFTTMPATTQTLGLDIGDRSCSWCLISADGDLLNEDVVLTRKEELHDFFGALEPCRVVLEACGHVHWIAKLVEGCGHELVVANPREVRLISKGGRKTDRNDARTLARLGRVDPNLLSPIKLRGDACRASRSLLLTRDLLVRERTRLVTFIRGQVKSAGDRVPTCSAASFHKVAPKHIPASLQSSIGCVLDLLSKLAEEIRNLDKQVDRVSEKQHPETAVLRQVQGVGPILALAYAATIEDPNKFASSRTVGQYVGLAPGLYSSGSKTPELRISKRGDRLLRRLLVNAASYILGPFGKDSDLRRFGERIARGKSQRDRARARIAVARKLACLLHHLWRTGSVWNPNYALSI